MPARLDDLHALPAPHLVLDRDLVVVEANRAYLELVGLPAAQLVGRPVLDALSPPGALGADGVLRLRDSFHEVQATGRPVVLRLDRYRVLDRRTGTAVDRWWSCITVPVRDGEGRVELLVQRVEELAGRSPGAGPGDGWHARALVAETQLLALTREVRAVREADRDRARALAALADAAVRIATAQDVGELVDVLLDRALTALGAQGGAVVLRDGDVVRLTATDPPTTAAPVPSGAVRRERSTLPLTSRWPGALTTATGRPVLLPDHAAVLAHGAGMDAFAAGTGCQAWVSLPLAATTGTGGAAGVPVPGALLVGWRAPQTFTDASLAVLEVFASRCGQALARLQARQVDEARARENSELAQALQRALLSEPAHPDGLDVVTRYRPAVARAQVGGDWYDSFVTADGLTTLVVGDVCGHDREAAAAMGQVRNLLRGLAYSVQHPPATLLTRLDRALAGLQVDALVTAVVAVVEPDGATGGHRVRWSNAGHPPPLLLHPDGRAELLETGAELLLGLDPAAPRSDHRVALAPGSTLLLYTDGLVERRGADLDEGLRWLAGSAAELAGASPDDLCDALLRQVADSAEDDVVLLALRT